MSNHIRYTRLFLLLLLVLCITSGCKAGGGEKDVTVKLDLEDTVYQIAEAAGFETTYNADAGFLEKSYGLGVDQISGFKALFGTMLDANRLVLFEATDQQQKKAAMDTAAAIKKQLLDSFGEAMPEQRQLAEGAITMEMGDYVLFLSGTDVEAGKAVFETIFSGAETIAKAKE